MKMGMNPEREAKAMKDLRTEKERRPTYNRKVNVQQITWREWEKTRNFPVYDGDNEMQYHQQRRCEMADNFSATFRRLVDDHDESLEDIADAIGKSVGALHSYLVNKRVPRLEVIGQIGKFYRIKPAHLIFARPKDYFG